MHQELVFCKLETDLETGAKVWFQPANVILSAGLNRRCEREHKNVYSSQTEYGGAKLNQR
jgi:hypothetical protein